MSCRSPATLVRCNHTAWQHGFTLVELLVTLVIMGIALGIVVVQLMPDERSILHEDAARLALLLENAGMEARASGRSMAWSGQDDHYRFWTKNDYNDWVRIEDDSPFRPRTLAGGVHIVAVTIDGLTLKPGEHLALTASAFTLPFRITLSNASATATVVGKSSGDVVVEMDGLSQGEAAHARQ